VSARPDAYLEAMRTLAKLFVLIGAAAVLALTADMVAPEQTGAVAQAAQAKKSTVRANKRLRPRAVRTHIRPVTTFPGVVPPRQEFVMPNPNFRPYNSGTVAPNVAPARDPIVPGVGVVPQLPSIVRQETFGDRAARCAHQAGAFNVPADQRGVYQNRCASGQ
jgi:hypothetical protein